MLIKLLTIRNLEYSNNEVSSCMIINDLKRRHETEIHVPYPPEISPLPLSSPVDMAQAREWAYFRICAARLEYKPLSADGFAYHLFSAYITLV